LNVSAKDQATGKEQKITIQNQSLSDEEIERMKADAEAHKEEDAKREELYAKLNMSQAYVNGIEKLLEDETASAALTEDEKNSLKPLMESLNTALKAYESAENKDAAMKTIEDAQKALEEVYNPIISRMYAAANPQAGTDGANANPFGNAADMFGGANGPFGNMGK
jgi:molecular chaperone DnaK